MLAIGHHSFEQKLSNTCSQTVTHSENLVRFLLHKKQATWNKRLKLYGVHTVCQPPLNINGSSESNCKLGRWVKTTQMINHCPDYQNTNFTREIHTRKLNNVDGNTNIMFIQVRCTVWFTWTWLDQKSCRHRSFSLTQVTVAIVHPCLQVAAKKYIKQQFIL